MSLKKGFLRNSNLHISPWLIVNGVLLGTLMSIIFYGLLVQLAEFFRLMQGVFRYGITLMSFEDIRFYKYALAFLSSVIGQSMGLQLMLRSIPKAKTGKARLSQKLLLHQVESTYTYWLFWVGRWLFIMAIVLCCTSTTYFINVREELGYLFFLLPLVWFLNNWLHAYRILRHRFYKYLGCAFVYLLLNTFAISHLSVGQHEAVNEKIVESYTEIEHHMELPETVAYQYQADDYETDIIHLFWQHGKVMAYIEDKGWYNHLEHPIPIEEAYDLYLKEHVIDRWYPFHIVLSIDKYVPHSAVLKFEDTLYALGIKEVTLRSTPKNSSLPWHYSGFRYSGLPKNLIGNCEIIPQYLDSMKRIGYEKDELAWPNHPCYEVGRALEGNRILVKQLGDEFWLNNSPISKGELTEKLIALVKLRPGKFTVFYEPDLKASYDQYMKGRDLIMNAFLVNRRAYYAQKFDGDYQYERLTWYGSKKHPSQLKTEAVYPIKIVELSGWNLEFYQLLKE